MFKYLQIIKPEVDYSLGRAFGKGLFLIFMGRLILDNISLKAVYETPDYFSRYGHSHPINPPIYQPHKWEEPERYEEFVELFQMISNIAEYSREQYTFKKCFHPSLEDGFIIKEAYFESEYERVFDELRSQLRKDFKERTKREIGNTYSNVERQYMYSRFKASIKPSM